MKKIHLIMLLFVTILLATSCTENQRAKNFGGTMTAIIPNNCVIVNATWKQNNLWVLYKDTTTNKLFLLEDSNFGILNGKIEFK